jgi:enoyl-CoA hydratase/carnithine racemase
MTDVRSGAYENILGEVNDGLGIITLNRPEARNPLDRTTSAEMLELFREFFANPKVRSIAVTGAGSSFCAGGDLSQMGMFSEAPTAEAFDWPGRIVELNRMMLSAPKPVIAAVNGHAYAGGMGLAGMCDVVLATKGAKFALPEVKIGIFPMIIVAQLCRSLPRKHLMEMMFTGEPMDADEAYRLGFVNKIYDTHDDLMAGVAEYGRKFRQASPDALRLGRRAFGILSELTTDQALDAAQFFVMPFHLGEDLKEGADAFLNHRQPKWVVNPEESDGA